MARRDASFGLVSPCARGDCSSSKPQSHGHTLSGGEMSTYGCTNPACSLALIGNYIVWFVSRGRDLGALLLEMGVSREVAISMVEDAASDGWTVKVIDVHHGVVAEREDDDQWSVWELRMHQSFDDELGA